MRSMESSRCRCRAWERSDFTLLFEAMVMAMAKEMPVKALAGLVGEEDKRIWRIVHHSSIRRSRRRTLPTPSRSGSMTRAFAAARTTSRCSATWTRASGERCS